jgi:large subunit ribosomal protein L4
MYRAALASIVSQLVRDDRFVVADDIKVDAPKTKNFVQILKNRSLNGTVVVIVSELTESLFLASRNLSNVLILESHQIDPYSLVRSDKVVFVKTAVNELQEQFV